MKAIFIVLASAFVVMCIGQEPLDKYGQMPETDANQVWPIQQAWGNGGNPEINMTIEYPGTVRVGEPAAIRINYTTHVWNPVINLKFSSAITILDSDFTYPYNNSRYIIKMIEDDQFERYEVIWFNVTSMEDSNRQFVHIGILDHFVEWRFMEQEWRFVEQEWWFMAQNNTLVMTPNHPAIDGDTPESKILVYHSHHRDGSTCPPLVVSRNMLPAGIDMFSWLVCTLGEAAGLR